MGQQSRTAADQDQIRNLLEGWANATGLNLRDQVLANHAPDVLIFDVLAPMKYEGAEAYRRSWDERQPDTQGESQFGLDDLVVVAGSDVAFAHCFIRCGGSLPNGTTFEGLVPATFCLQKIDRIDGVWKITHQHISKPFRHRGKK